MRQPPPSGRLLIVDSDPAALNALAATVRRRLPSIVVDTALSAHAAFRQCAAADYDGILSDVQLQDAEGQALLTAWTQHRREADLILLAKQPTADLSIRAGLHGVFHVLCKPIEHNLLLATLGHVLKRRVLERRTADLTRQLNRQRRRIKKALAHARLMLESHERILARRREALTDAGTLEAFLMAALDHTSEAVVAVDGNWIILAANAGARQQLFGGRDLSELRGRPLWEEAREWTGSVIEQECRRALQEGKPLLSQMLLPRVDRWYAIRAVPAAHGLLLYFRDLTSRGRRDDAAASEQASAGPPAASHASQVVTKRADASGTGQDDDRLRLGHQLQQEWAPPLATLRDDLAWVERHSAQDDRQLVLKLRFMAQAVQRMGQALARVTAQARPAILDELGLTGAVQWEVSSWEHRTGIRCTLTAKDLDALDDPVATTVFRLLYECLRHLEQTRPSRASITMATNGLHVAVEMAYAGGRGSSIDFTPLTDSARLLGATVVAAAGMHQTATRAILTLPLARPARQ